MEAVALAGFAGVYAMGVVVVGAVLYIPMSLMKAIHNSDNVCSDSIRVLKLQESSLSSRTKNVSREVEIYDSDLSASYVTDSILDKHSTTNSSHLTVPASVQKKNFHLSKKDVDSFSRASTCGTDIDYVLSSVWETPCGFDFTSVEAIKAFENAYQRERRMSLENCLNEI